MLLNVFISPNEAANIDVAQNLSDVNGIEYLPKKRIPIARGIKNRILVGLVDTHSPESIRTVVQKDNKFSQIVSDKISYINTRIKQNSTASQ